MKAVLELGCQQGRLHAGKSLQHTVQVQLGWRLVRWLLLWSRDEHALKFLYKLGADSVQLLHISKQPGNLEKREK